MGVKNFVVDTNVVLFDPEAIFKLQDNNVILPDIVLEEIDHFKNEQSERGRNSRKVSRYLDELAKKGNLVEGVPLGDELGIIKIAFTPIMPKVVFQYDLEIYDNRILYLCFCTKGSILITKDVNLRVKANTIGIRAEDYRNEKAVKTKSELYLGRCKAFVPDEQMELFRNGTPIDVESLYDSNGSKFSEKIYVNEFFELYPASCNSKSCLIGRFDGKAIIPLQYATDSMCGITPRNLGQRMMMECLLAPADVAPLVIIKGIAGTAKTLFALAAGMSFFNEGKKNPYKKILICRPSVTMDEDIGYLPGSENEKIAPYMRAIKDNVFTILNANSKINSASGYSLAEKQTEQYFMNDFIHTEALAYQRGRSLNDTWFILDEMQNSTIRQAKGVVTRIGQRSKVILLGDPEQIDSPYMDSFTNGLTHASEKMKGSSLCWQVTMKESECERSPLAKEAANRM